MTERPTAKFELLDELYKTDSYAAFKVSQSGRILRLIKISPGLSASTSFRAAFRKDQSVLANVQHDGILQLLDSGDDDGQLFYLTEFPDGTPLAARLDAGESFANDELTDIGWQIASAIQYAHNLGIAHGHLTLKSVLVADPLRIRIAGFGLYRWMAAAEGNATEPWNDLATRDLIAIGNILKALAPAGGERNDSGDEGLLDSELQALITELTSPQPSLTARDVQGRLGNLLLRVAGDSIQMVDDREGQGLSRRSIVDELFDEPDESQSTVVASMDHNSRPQRKRDRMPTFFVVVAAVVVLLTVLTFAASLTATRPTNLGVTEGRLASVSSSPNSVSTQTDSEEHRILPFEFDGSSADAMACLRIVVLQDGNAVIIEQQDNYLYVEFRSRFFRFIDDVEFHVDGNDGQVHFRSASRTGYSDLGINRSRMERLRTEFVRCCVSAK